MVLSLTRIVECHIFVSVKLINVTMEIQMNQSLSVDCVVFGYGNDSLKVLLVDHYMKNDGKHLLKLPGSMIRNNENLNEAAKRVLFQMVGLRDVNMKQVGIFSDPQRVTQEDLQWINNFHGIETKRVVTMGYYTMVKLNSQTIKATTAAGAHWKKIDSIQSLALDHKLILSDALTLLYREFIQSPIVFELLPKKFVLSELQNIYSNILGVEIDKRNFRKKILSTGFIIPTGEKEVGVAHKPAMFFTFSRTAYNKALKTKSKTNFINNWIY